jgi:hypothetical protein
MLRIMQNDIRFAKVPFEPFWTVIERVEPVDENSPVSRLLNTGNHLYHICFRVPDLQRTIKEAGRHGFHRLGKPVPAPALGEDASRGFSAGNTGPLNWSKPAGPRSDH